MYTDEMPRVPFETIALWDAAIFLEQIPQELLIIFGWTKQEYLNEILKRVDEAFIACHKELYGGCLSN